MPQKPAAEIVLFSAMYKHLHQILMASYKLITFFVTTNLKFFT